MTIIKLRKDKSPVKKEIFKMYPNLMPTAIRDNYDDDNLSDIDDEVFIRDSKSGIIQIDDESADKRPLMPPRRRGKHYNNMDRYSMPYKVLVAPFCYGVLALLILIALILLGVFTFNVIFPLPLNLMRRWLISKSATNEPIISQVNNNETVACTFLTNEVIWTKTFPKFGAEAPLRKNDVNADGVEDVIVGFSVGLDLLDFVPEYVCEAYFKKQTPCLGGVMALNGKTGETLWIHWNAHAIFSVDCDIDLTLDNVKDCVISGRGAILQAISGRDGSTIWEIEQNYSPELLDVYDAKFVADLDGDGVADVVASHIVQDDKTRNSRIILLSGMTGTEIRSVDLPESEQLFVAPQTLVQPDGDNIFILATNSKKKSGGLYIVPESVILRGEMKLRKLHHGPGKGVSLPPILADITSDGTEDIIAAMFSSTIIAYDGITFHPIWNYSVPNSEIISIPIPGYYNDDDIPDFMVKHQIGPGFPVYYYTKATILDGKTGKPLLERPMEDTMSAQMSGLSITIDGFGNDWFLHWSSDCLNHEGARSKYRFVEEQDPGSESRADLCKLRFNSTLVSKFYAMSQHVAPPGLPVYSSENWKEVEFSPFEDPREEAERFMQQEAEKQMKQENNDESLDTADQQKMKEQGHYYPRGQDYESDVNMDGKPGEKDFESSYKMYDNNYDDSQLADNVNEIRSQRSNRRIKSMVNENEAQHDNPDFGERELKEKKVLRKKRDLEETSYLDMEFERDNKTSDDRTENSTFHESTTSETTTLKVPFFLDDAKLEMIFKKQSIGESFDKEYILRSKRDVKTKLMKGVQRQPPTGILLPPLKKVEEGKSKSVDLVFTTYWLPASEIPFVLLQEDIECIQNQKAQLVNEPEKSDEEKIMSDCLAKRGIDFRLYQEALDKENTRISLGQMTIYRVSIKCGCPEDMLPGQSCKNISTTQSWSAHLGEDGNGYFKPWRQPKKHDF